MTVGELIKYLQKYPSSKDVVFCIDNIYEPRSIEKDSFPTVRINLSKIT